MKFIPEVDSLLDSYLQNRDKEVLEIQDCLKKHNLRQIESIAHKLKGSAGSYGFEELSAVGASMEIAASNCVPSEVEKSLSEMTGLLTRVRQFIAEQRKR